MIDWLVDGNLKEPISQPYSPQVASSHSGSYLSHITLSNPRMSFYLVFDLCLYYSEIN